MNKNYLIDTHSHINMIENIPLDEIIKNAEQNNVKKNIIPASSASDIDIVYELSQKYENIYCYLGIHPEEAKDWSDLIANKIKIYAKSNKVAGIGEIGLDYYWDKSNIELQKEVFIQQIQLANELNLPMNVHDREAHKDTFDILKEYNKSSKVIMHCFSGSVEFANECIREGFYIALGGVVTFKNAKKMKEVAINIPLERLLLETDAPYLTPVPYRGKENQPAYIKYTAEEIAKLREISIDELTQITTSNAEEILSI